MTVALYIENERIDLFPEDNIEIVSSIADSSDITKVTTDYSKSFSVPASDTNNRIFKHYYNATIDNTFDARIKTNGRIEIDGLPFKSGKIQLEKVNVKSLKASSYSLRFFGKLVAFKDKVKDDELPSLDLSALNFEYTQGNIITALTSSLSSGKIICNLLSKKRFYYNSDPTDTTNTETTTNIANEPVNPNQLRPSIQLIEVIKAIEEKYDVSFSRDFFDRAGFTNLYLWLNNSIDILGQKTSQLINWNGGNGSDFGLSNATDTWVNSTYFDDGLDYRIFKYRITINTTNTDPYDVVVKNNNIEIARFNSSGGNFTSDFIEIKTTELTNFSYQFFVESNKPMSYTASILLRRTLGGFPLPTTENRTSTASTNTITPTFDISLNLPKVKIIDFIKDLTLLFKLVFIQNSETEIYVNTLPDYYSEGRLFDITKYVNFESHEVNRGTLFNELLFKFENPKTILNEQFKINTTLGYGDEELRLADENGDLLDGEKLEIAPKVEQIIYERLPDINTGELTNIQYGLSADRELKPVNPTLHIFYNTKANVTDTPFRIIVDPSGTEADIIGEINTPSHTDVLENSNFAVLFSEEFSTWNGALISNNLYTNYWSSYIESVFNIKRRNFVYSAYLPLHILLALKLNDVLLIDGNYYRIDKYTANIITGKVDFNLINSFDNTINPFATNETIVFSDAKSGTRSIYVKGNSDFTISLNDGSWITATIEGRNVILEIDVNRTGLDRQDILEITSGSETIEIVIFQNAEIVRADNNVITADTNLITADNG